LNTVTINGITITSVRSINISGNRVIVDGNDVTPDAKEIRIEVNGNIESLSVDACNTIMVTGSVGDLATQSGDVKCGDVSGSVKTMSGDVRCGVVKGSVKTMSGDINHQ
jgi:hypothetical protein